jgi:hypothetical protein
MGRGPPLRPILTINPIYSSESPEPSAEARVQFDDDTWEAIEAVSHDGGESFQGLADEAFKGLLKKRNSQSG